MKEPPVEQLNILSDSPHQMASDAPVQAARLIQAARTWYFKTPRVARPEISCFDPNFFIHILDNRKPTQTASISKADTICFMATEVDRAHAAVEGFIHSDSQMCLGTVQRWLVHPAVQESVQWTLVTAARNSVYAATAALKSESEGNTAIASSSA
jgi:hypothetical protein